MQLNLKILGGIIMKAYILTVIALATFGLLLIVGELNLALDGLAFSDTRILVGFITVLVAAWIGFTYYPFYREEIVECINEALERPEEEEDPEEEEEGEEEVADFESIDWNSIHIEKDWDSAWEDWEDFVTNVRNGET